MAKPAHDLPDLQALGNQLDTLAAALLDLSTDTRVATDAVRRTVAAVEPYVRHAAQQLHTHGADLAELLADRPGPEAEPDSFQPEADADA